MTTWINVKEKLPSKLESVIYWDETIKQIGWAFYNSFGEWVNGNKKTQGITHWMHLPKPPEKGKTVTKEPFDDDRDIVIQDPIYTMNLGDCLQPNGSESINILRVPGGWIYTSYSENGTGGYDMSSCFVRFDNEFQKI